ncbi:protein of unknown function [Candidatus Promineifilum breve]|uniref:Uncharacterized protein n=1 Tax=Candidatus Promineifilum breve TaxID=1806508 RepID=A0A161KAI2_9CHLR|nr:protein of unknown function [Candidatus Promineifilum breve]
MHLPIILFFHTSWTNGFEAGQIQLIPKTLTPFGL